MLVPDGFLFLLAVVVPIKIFLLLPTDAYKLSPIRVEFAYKHSKLLVDLNVFALTWLSMRVVFA